MTNHSAEPREISLNPPRLTTDTTGHDMNGYCGELAIALYRWVEVLVMVNR